MTEAEKEHTVEETLTEILRRLDSIAESMLTISNYFREKGRDEFGIGV